MFIPESELIINEDGSVYHLKLHPGDIANRVITVGDQNRVDQVAQHFDEIYLTKQNREFKTVTGRLGSKDITVISTGIGTDNIDIVINELDALVNVDFKNRTVNAHLKQLDFIRIGTSGTIREEIALDSIITSAYAASLDGIADYYPNDEAAVPALSQILSDKISKSVYAFAASDDLINQFNGIGHQGITLTAAGFYGPQSRGIRIKPSFDWINQLVDVEYEGLHCTNLEMETAGIFLLSKLLGHRAIAFNAILANRATREFSKQPKETVRKLIENVLTQL